MIYGPKKQYGDYVVVSGHNLPIEAIRKAEKANLAQINLFLANPPTDSFRMWKDEMWEHLSALYPENINGKCAPVTVFAWKTILEATQRFESPKKAAA